MRVFLASLSATVLLIHVFLVLGLRGFAALLSGLTPVDALGTGGNLPVSTLRVAVIETAPWLEVCRAALASHRSQVNTEDDFWQFYRIMQELPGAGEAYLLAAGRPFPASDAPASDLFAGL